MRKKDVVAGLLSKLVDPDRPRGPLGVEIDLRLVLIPAL
jgi:hypothetical protein